MQLSIAEMYTYNSFSDAVFWLKISIFPRNQWPTGIEISLFVPRGKFTANSAYYKSNVLREKTNHFNHARHKLFIT